MRFLWISTALLLSFFTSVPINGDTFHYKVIRKICPLGTYHDPIGDKCRRVPGGGEMIKINLDARCSGRFVGLLADSRKSRYYYVCNRDSVLTCMCAQDELFSKIRLRCESSKRSSEEFTHDVVDDIFNKYKCAVMNEESVEARASEAPEIAEAEKGQNATMLEQFLQFLTFIYTSLFAFMKQNEATTTTTAAPGSYWIFLPGFHPTTTTVPVTESTKSIREEIEEFQRTWRINQLTTTPAPSSEVSERSFEPETPPTTTLQSRVSEKEPETTTEFVELSTLEDRAFKEDVTRRTSRKKKRKQKIPQTTVKIEEYYEYFYDDEPDKVLWTLDIEEPEPTPQPRGETESPPESMILTTTEENFVMQRAENFETTTVGEPAMTTEENFVTSTIMEPAMTTEMTTEISVATEETSTEALKTTTVLGETTTLNVPAPLIMRMMDDNVESTTAAEKTTMLPESTTISEIESTTVTEKSETTEFPESTTVSEIESTSFIENETTTEFFESTTVSEIESTTVTEIQTTTEFPERTTNNEIETTSMMPESTKISETESTTTFDSDFESTTFDFERSFDSTTQNIDTTVTEFISTTLQPETTFASTTFAFTQESTTQELIDTTTEQISTSTEFSSESTTPLSEMSAIFSARGDEEITTEAHLATTETIESVHTTDPQTLPSTTELTTVSPTTTDLNERMIITTDRLPIVNLISLGPEKMAKKMRRIKKVKLGENGSEIEYSFEVYDDIDDLAVAARHDETSDFETTSTTTTRPQKPLFKQDQKKREDIEYYYDYEEYEVDEDGNPLEIIDTGGGEKFSKSSEKKQKKKNNVKMQRDNSYEYYVESISASEEIRKSDPDYFNYFY